MFVVPIMLMMITSVPLIVSGEWVSFVGAVGCLSAVGSVGVVAWEHRRVSTGMARVMRVGSGVWFGESPRAAVYRFCFIVALVLAMLLIALWGRSRFVSAVLSVLMILILVDAVVRLCDRRRFGLCGEGLWWRTWWGGWRCVPWGEVGFPQFDAAWTLIVPVERGRLVRLARFETDSDVRAMWAMVVFYRANPERRGELVDGSFVRTVSSGVLPLPQ